ncbi:MAG: conserved hypothetical rane associated protein [Herminiimonas sp.]|nr:conserved hypothetical rane associated protein [Herminiimonas sp.]
MKRLSRPSAPRCFLRAPLLALSLLAGCATGVSFTPATIAPTAASESRSVATIAKKTDVRFDNGYSRVIEAGTVWSRIGSIAQGDVYKGRNTVFTLEGAHIHEAFLVVANGNLTGFYLPVERGFSPLDNPIALPFSSTPQ